MVVRPVNSQLPLAQITILEDGSINGTDKIIRNGNIYYLTQDLHASLFIKKDNIVFDGGGFSLQGSGSLTNEHGFNEYDGPESETAVVLTNRINDTIKNIGISNFGVGIALYNSTYCVISNNKLKEINGYPGAIYLNDSNNNWLQQNDVEDTIQISVSLLRSDSNTVSANRIVNGSGVGVYIFGSYDTIVGNAVSNNGIYGITISSKFSKILDNNISSDAGIFLNGASGNLISGNNISNRDIGFDCGDGDSNTFFENNIIGNGNSTAILFSGTVNNQTFYSNNIVNNVQNIKYLNDEIPPFSWESIVKWDNGTVGNYWSDYITKCPAAKETDNTGTYDTPYALMSPPYSHIFYDNCPLVLPVKTSQNTATEVPSWITSTPVLIFSNQSFIIILFFVSILLVFVLILIAIILKNNRSKKK